MLEESRYLQLADLALRELEDLLADVDAEDVDCERAGDVVTLTFANGKRCVINTQRPTRQMWVAADARAWHFDWHEDTGQWIDAKQAHAAGASELFVVLKGIVREQAGVTLS